MSLPSERVSRALESLHWSARELAAVLDIRYDSVLKWLAGRLSVPPPVLAWLEQLAAFHDTHPPPARPVKEGDPEEKHAFRAPGSTTDW